VSDSSSDSGSRLDQSDSGSVSGSGLEVDVLSIFPEFFTGPLDASLLGKARHGGLLSVTVHDPRAWARDRHRSVDDEPYGGGAGMVMKPEPFVGAVEDRYGDLASRPRTVVFTPRGRPLEQALVAELAVEPALLLVCGRYEGIDERVHQLLAHDEVSIGDYVLAGGEAAAVVLIEAVARLLPGVVGNQASVEADSFATGLLEHPQYTRPPSYRGLQVPEVLRGGDHGAIARWRREQAEARTRRLRPDLLERAEDDDQRGAAP